MSLNRMILCSKLKNGLRKIVTKSQVVTKFNVTKSRFHCTSKLLFSGTTTTENWLILKISFVAAEGIQSIEIGAWIRKGDRSQLESQPYIIVTLAVRPPLSN